MKTLYDRHAERIRAYALRASGRTDVADEVAQETFIRAFKGLKKFDGRSCFSTWLFAIALNRTRTELGRRRPAETLEADALADPHPPAERDAWLRRRIESALSELPEGYRESVVLHDVMGLEHQEIAAIRGCTVGTSKSQLHKARAKLRERLSPVWGPDAGRRAEA